MLALSGACGGQLPQMPSSADLVTCGIGFNDIMYTGPRKLFADLRMLLAAVPDQTVLLDLPVPVGYGGWLGRASRPYVMRINRGLPVAEISVTLRPCPGWPACSS